MNNIAIECELFGALQRTGRQSRFSLKIRPQTNYRRLLTDYLHFAPQHLRYLIVVNGQQQVTNLAQKIPIGSKIRIMMPLGGG
jgi:hypothetical protein